MSHVLVLMSTWNGERFLKEQLESIFSQSVDGDIHILVRDDGSSDGTLGLLNNYQSSRITVIRGDNLGAKASFLELLRLAQGIEADYYALADQDDVWDTDKIACAINCIIDPLCPTLYSSAVELVDQNLVHLSTYTHPGDRSFASTLLCNYVTGCTCVFNRALLEIIHFPADSNHILMHDWWLGIIASACGKVFYDNHPHIKYRQHGGNHVGIARGARGIWQRILKNLNAPSVPSRITQAQSFRDAYTDQIPEAFRETLCHFLASSGTRSGRMQFVWSIRIHISVITIIRFVLFS